MLVDANGKGNILNYGSNGCKRITLSFMAAEINALILGFYFAYVVPDMLRDILGRLLSTESHVDSRTVFEVVEKMAQIRSGASKLIY